MKKNLTKFDDIFSLLESKGEGIFKVEYLNKTIVRINFKDYLSKYIIFEPEEIYTDTIELVTFLNELNAQSMYLSKSGDRVLRIPFFAGTTGSSLASFLFNDIPKLKDVSLDKNFQQPISFTTYPSNFNIYGLKRFCKYLEIVKITPPSLKSLNNYNNYIEYFEELVKDNGGKINLFLPLDMIKLCPDNDAINGIFKKLQEDDKDSK